MKLKKLKRSDFEGKFEFDVLERGKKYFNEGRVGNIMVVGGMIKTKVHGTRAYDVTISLNYDDLSCTCPYFYDRGNCKHIAAVFYKLLMNPRIDYVEKSFVGLETKSKEQLIDLIKKMVEEEPRLRHLISKNPSDVSNEIQKLKETIEHETFEEMISYVKYLRKIVETFTGVIKISLLEELFLALYESYHEYGGLPEPVEDMMYEIIEEISRGMKSLNKDRRESMIRRMKSLRKTDDTGLRDYVFEPLEKYF